MPSDVAPRRDFQGLEVRRRQAAALFAAGKETQAAIARRLGVTRQSALRWFRAWRAGGRRALRGAGRAGRKPKLEPQHLGQVDAALRRGPHAHGFGTALWTLPRIALVIERLTGVHYHPGHVWRLLGALGWTLQRPATQARARNEAAVRAWRATRWPAVKKTPAGGAPGSSSKMKVGSRSARRSGGPGRPGARRPS